MVVASVTGVFKMILMIIGGMVLLRFIGQLLIAKRNLAEEKSFLRQKKEADELKQKSLKNYGKTTIVSAGNTKSKKSTPSIEDVDYEDLSDK